MNKKNILIITGIGILFTLLIITSIALVNTQKELRLLDNFVGYTIHQLSIKNYEKGYDVFDLKELVVGNEKGYCEAVEGLWNEETRECLNIHEKYCRLITGSIKIEDESGKMGNCILK